MSLSSSPELNPTQISSTQSIHPPEAMMQPFIPGQCLFCPNSSPSFTGSVVHMQKSHGLFLPHQRHQVVDLETIFRYLHLVIFGYRECIHCGTQRTTLQAVQQHMTAKGHCKFDASETDSEFADFYDFSETKHDAESDVSSDDDEGIREEAATDSRANRKPMLADEDSICLPSGKIISKRSTTTQAAPTVNQLRRRTQRTLASQLVHSLVEADEDNEEASSKEEPDPDIPDTRVLSKREKREKAVVAYQMTNMRANDRNSLMHLPASQQRSMLVTQNKHMEKVQKEERRRRGKIDRKGNKNLYAYWATETPVYSCG
ncbi:hypothetical protein diail_9063 [Diaporthe ilicicola]|nr:hypothetical protein diail_9063 [Diaporthe ilicicola]